MHKKYHEFIVKTIHDNMTHNKATLISTDFVLIQFCSLEDISQRGHLLFLGLLTRCLWNYVNHLRHTYVAKEVSKHLCMIDCQDAFKGGKNVLCNQCQ